MSPALFLQGDRDATCDVERCARRSCASARPRCCASINEADRQFKVLKKSGRTQEEVIEQMTDALDDWIQSILGGTT